MQTGSSGTLIGWKSGQTTYFPLWDRYGGSVAMDSEDFCPNYIQEFGLCARKKEFKIRGGRGSGEIHMK